MTIDQAIQTVITNCNNGYAVAYARYAMRAAYDSGVNGLKTQVMYILSNTRGWNDEIAHEAKKVMRTYIKE